MTGKKYNKSLHAEMNALFKSIKQKKHNRFVQKKQDIPSKTIYVVRLLRGKPDNCNGNPLFMLGNSQPCDHCQKYLALYNITKIRYTDIINDVSVLCELRLKNDK